VSFHRWKVVTIYLAQPSALRLADIRPKAERRYRRGQAANPGTGRAPKSPYLALLQVGFSRRCVTAVGRTLLPSDFTLIPIPVQRTCVGTVCFCATFRSRC